MSTTGSRRQHRVDRAVAHERVVIVVVDKVVLQRGVVLRTVAQRILLFLVQTRLLELQYARLKLRDYLVPLSYLKLQRAEMTLESALDVLL